MLCPKSVVITGTNRGIGLELLKQFCHLPNPPKHLFATCRNPDDADELQKLAKEYTSIHIVKLEVCDHSQLEGLAAEVEKHVKDEGLNLLICNAGYLDCSSIENGTADELRKSFEINSIAPYLLFKLLLPLLKKASQVSNSSGMSCSKAAIINISSVDGSLAMADTGMAYGYRMSKAALNMLTRTIAWDYSKDDILAVTMDPGYLKTDMGWAYHSRLTEQGEPCEKPNDTLEHGVKCLLDVLAGLDKTKSGNFISHTGDKIAW